MTDLPMPIEMPRYTRNERLAEIGVSSGEKHSDFSVRFNNLLNHFKLEPADIVKGCPLASYPTICGWANGEIEIPAASELARQVMNYFGVSSDFFFYGIPLNERDFEIDRAINKNKDSVSA